MNFIHNQLIALDTNQFIFALRQDPTYSSCQILLFEKLHKINVYLPLLDSGKFSMRVSGEKKIGHPVQKSAVMSETG